MPLEGINTLAIPDYLEGGLSYLQTYTYSCLEGFTTNDDICVVCLPNKTLSLLKPPNCTGK